MEEHVHDEEEEFEDDGFEEDARREFERLEKRLDRKLTQAEVEGIAGAFVEQYTKGKDVDGQAALTAHHEAGGREYDLDSRADRQSWMLSRLEDSRAETAPEPDPDRTYDLDLRADRIAYMIERSQGVEFEDVEAEE